MPHEERKRVSEIYRQVYGTGRDSQTNDIGVQSDSADIHYVRDGKVSRSAQITEEQLQTIMQPSDQRYLPQIKQSQREPQRSLSRTPSLPDLVGYYQKEQASDDRQQIGSPIYRVMKKFDDRERDEHSYHRYLDEREQMIEQMRNKVVPGVANRHHPFVPSVSHNHEDSAHLRARLHKLRHSIEAERSQRQ